MALKVLHLPTSVGGMSWGLAQGERALGLNSEVLVTFGNWLNYEADINLKLDQSSNNIYRLYKLIKTFLSIKSDYDVYHFNYGSSLVDIRRLGLHLIDLPYYSRKAKLFVTYNGCDARQKYSTISRTSCSACHHDDCYNGKCINPKIDKMKIKRINKMARFTNTIFAVNPDLKWHLPEEAIFLPYAISGYETIQYMGSIYKSRTIKIAHAPTNRGCKGSEIILSVLKKLKKKYNIEIMLIENVPHKDALKIYAEADLVIDQLLVGWYGGLAVEVMKMGKPVVCFIREDDLKYIPQDMKDELPIIIANQDNLYEVMAYCIENPKYLRDKAKQSLEYVLKWHDPKYVAGIVKDCYEK